MTLKEIQSDVYALGYEMPTCESDLFISALNRALRIIYAEQKYKKSVRIHVRSPKISHFTPSVRLSGSQLTLPLVGRAYSMRVCGKGDFKISSTTLIREESFDGEEILIRGFIDGNAELTLLTDYSVTVYDLAVYSETFSDRVEDIPDSADLCRVDFSRYGDFASFADVPRDSLGREIRDARIEGSEIFFVTDRSYDAYVSYYRAPMSVSFDDEDNDIDIPRSAEAMLPLLCASFLWRDDEPQLAEHYYSLYRELRRAEESLPTGRVLEYKSTDRWA